MNDFQDIFTEIEEDKLNAFAKIQDEKGLLQIAVVSLGSLGSYSNINDYSLDLANYWG